MRRPNKKLFVILTAAASLAAFAALGQEQKTPPPGAEEKTGTLFSSTTRLVVLHTTVTDKSGHLVTDLPQSAFTVYENGVSQPIKTFKREDVPVSMGLVVDNSGSMRDKRAKV